MKSDRDNIPDYEFEAILGTWISNGNKHARSSMHFIRENSKLIEGGIPVRKKTKTLN
jgi:hypothetical protein